MAIDEVENVRQAGGFLVVGLVEVSFSGRATSGSAHRTKSEPA
jgi:hypothetical protein